MVKATLYKTRDVTKNLKTKADERMSPEKGGLVDSWHFSTKSVFGGRHCCEETFWSEKLMVEDAEVRGGQN